MTDKPRLGKRDWQVINQALALLEADPEPFDYEPTERQREAFGRQIQKTRQKVWARTEQWEEEDD